MKNALGDQKLYGLVNNAGTGIEHGVTDDVVIKTNFYGPKRVCDNFLPMIDRNCGRIVNVGSGAGPAFVDKISDVAVKKQVLNIFFAVIMSICHVLYCRCARHLLHGRNWRSS